MKKDFIVGILAGVLTLFIGTGGYAALVYDNGTPNLDGGYEATQYIEADDFTLFSPTRLHRIRFWSIERILPPAPGFQGSMTWFIYANNAGEPGSILYTGHTAHVRHREEPDRCSELCGVSQRLFDRIRCSQSWHLLAGIAQRPSQL